MTTPPLVTLPEAADRLRVSQRTLHRLIGAGRLRPVRIGRRTLVTEREIAAYESRRRLKGTGGISWDKTNARFVARVSLGMVDGRRKVRSAVAETREEAETRLRDLLADYPRAKRGKKKRHARPPISPKLRFLILERDGFRCRYCGATPPDVRLVVDHVVSVRDGGATEPGNLKAACWECNAGKRERSL